MHFLMLLIGMQLRQNMQLRNKNYLLLQGMPFDFSEGIFLCNEFYQVQL